jgi:hypothetical protein
MSGRLWRWMAAALVSGIVRLVLSFVFVDYVPDPSSMFRAGYYTIMSTVQLCAFGVVWFWLRRAGGERFGSEHPIDPYRIY